MVDLQPTLGELLVRHVLLLRELLPQIEMNSAEDSDYGQAWGTARLPQMMLSVRFANGNRRSYAYTDFVGADYLGNVIRLYFYHATLMVRGKGLEELDGQTARHTVRYIREQHVSPFEAGETTRYIERIEIGPPQLEALAQRRTG